MNQGVTSRRRDAKPRRASLYTVVALSVAVGFGCVMAHTANGSTQAEPVGTPTRETVTARLAPLTLDLVEVVRRGNIAEVKGSTQPGATVFINGERVPLVLEDGSFTYLQIVPEEEFLLTVTAQNPFGVTKTLHYRGPAR